MKTYNVAISSQAKIDLDSIDDYISNELLAPHSALKIIRKIKARADSLKILPERCHRYAEEPWFSMGIRVTRVEHYYLFFHINEDERIVTILHILYSRRDIAMVLKKRVIIET